MKQVLQDARTGDIEVAEVPAPQLLPGCVLVRIEASLVSAGTERAASEFASKNIFRKAKSRPDLVREVMKKVRRDGLVSAIEAVRNRLDQSLALGYSSSGTVIGIGDGITDLSPGDRIACAGAGHAVHAEVACVPRLLVARIPEASGISFEAAAFTTVGAVALHGIRTADAKLGEIAAVIGLGLLGQLTVQMLKAAGCHVVGLDIEPSRAELALRLGADAAAASTESFVELCDRHSGGAGVDCVLICADTSSSELVNLAARIARDRGTVTPVGTVGLNIDRKLYYEKELDFRISRSYGPGRYDTAYEQKGRDYPIGYVRWTENRNMEAFLRLLADEKVDVKPLITHRFSIDRSRAAYELIQGRRQDYLGIVLTYPSRCDETPAVELTAGVLREVSGVTASVIGAGNFATGTLLPALRRVPGVSLSGVCSASGVHARRAASKFGFRCCTTDEQQIINDPQSNTIIIATRHQQHARQVLAALGAGKHVFCEKPLCLNEDELAEMVRACDGNASVLMVGFNRRFAPMAARLKSFLAEVGEPLAITYRVNAGQLPRDHWVNDPEQGGGRIIGELCHFVDFASFLSGSTPVEVHARALKSPGDYGGDNLVVFTRFANGAQATITYVANGDRAFSKERVEVFGGGVAAVLDDFRRLELVRNGRRQVIHSRWRQDKGHVGEMRAFVESVRAGRPAPIPFDEIVASTLTTFRVRDSLAVNEPMAVDLAGFFASALHASSAGSVPA